MHLISRIFLIGYLLIVALFFTCGIGLIVLSAVEAWNALNPAAGTETRARFEILLECIGLLTIAVASLELGQTVLEEEIQRSANISSPTRVRRFLSRFLIVVVVSLSVECLIGVFQFVHSKPEFLPHAASVGLAAAAILVTWGVFVRMNTEAEKLEPEAMQEVKDEDDAVEGEDTSADKNPEVPVHANETQPSYAPRHPSGQPHQPHQRSEQPPTPPATS